MSIAIIINPISGGAGPDVARRRAEQAASVAAGLGEAAVVHVTERAGHAKALALESACGGARVVFAWGGDGTVNEVASALAFGPAALGIIPAGSGNGLARELGVPVDPGAAIRRGVAAAPRVIDAGDIDGRLFFNVAGIGFDAHVAALFNAEQGPRGLRRYAAITVRELAHYAPQAFDVTTGGVTTRRRPFLMSFANSAQFGNGARIAPGARLDDGRLDLVMLEERSRFMTVLAAPRLFLGGLERVAGVTRALVDDVRVEADAPVVYHADGDAHTAGRTVLVRVRPGALRVSA